MDTSNRPLCMPNTRVKLLLDTSDWLARPAAATEDKRIFWLHGVAGSGKSAFATTVAHFFRVQHHLGAFVSFNQDRPADSTPSRAIQTLAAQLATFDARIGRAVVEAIKSNLGVQQSPRQQFDQLIATPLK